MTWDVSVSEIPDPGMWESQPPPANRRLCGYAPDDADDAASLNASQTATQSLMTMRLVQTLSALSVSLWPLQT